MGAAKRMLRLSPSIRWQRFISAAVFLSAAFHAGASIVVLGLSQKAIVLAADSRVGQSGHFVDSECKIAALNDRTLYAATGLGRYPAELLGGHGWSGKEAAENVVIGLGNLAPLERLGATWASTMERNLARSMQMQPRLTASAIEEDGGIVTGIFARLAMDSRIEAIVVYIGYSGSHFDHRIESITQPAVRLFGDGRVIAWIRARAATQRFTPDSPGQLGGWIEAAIKARVADNVGGVVSIVELERGSAIRWNKSVCPN
jgi:hypothetical protein